MEIRNESFCNGRIKLYCGACESVIPTLKLKPKNVNLGLIDPPYNIGYKYSTCKDNLSWDEYYDGQAQMILSLRKILKAKGSILYLNYPEQAAMVFCRIKKYFTPVEWITWIYHQHTGGKPLRKATRTWLWLSKSESGYYVGQDALLGEYRNPTDYDWWMYEQVKNVSKEKTDHPCQLPLEMVQRLVKAACPNGGVVIDPYMGSGTTAEACINAGRGFVGIEYDEKYFDICVKRVENVLGLDTRWDAEDD